MAKALITSEELIAHIEHVVGMNPSKVVMTKDRISFVRGKQVQYSFRCVTEGNANLLYETKYVYDKWEQALNYLCDMRETPIFLELLPRGGMKLTSAIIVK